VFIGLLLHAPCKASGESAWQEDEHHSPSSAFQQATPDLIGRNSASEVPDRLWVADITYLRSREGLVYLTFILDACSRNVVGWSMATHLRTELVDDALQMATTRRKPALQGSGTTLTEECSSLRYLSERGLRMRGWCRRWAGWTRPTITPSLSLCRHPEDGASPSEQQAYPADSQDCFSAEYIEGFLQPRGSH
jgi:transposase InsO family protein